MSAFTDRVYAEFVARNGGSARPARRSQRTRPTFNHYAQWRQAHDAFVSGGMGRSPMERSGTDPEFSGARTLGALDAAVAVRLPLRSFAP